MASKAITVDFNARLTKFEDGIKKATQKLDGFAANANKKTQLLKGAFRGLAAVVSVGALGLATKNALDYADGIANAAEQTGFTTKRIQELRFAAGQTDISMQTLDGAMARFTKRLGLARRGAGAAAKTYKQLGIDLSQTNDQVFQDVVGVLGNMTDDTNRLALATRLFGDDAQRMGVLLAGGNEGLKSFADKAHELGLILDDEMAQNASKANDQLSIMQQVIKTQVTSALVELAPTITEAGNAFAKAVPQILGFFDALDGDAETLNGQKAQLASVNTELNRLLTLQEKLKGGSTEQTFMDKLLGRPAEAERIQTAIDGLWDQYHSLNKEINGVGEASKEASAGVSAQVSALDGLRDAIEGASSAAVSYKETVKLFSDSKETPFKSQASDAEKISATYRKISAATAAASTGDEDAAKKVEAAAAAVNELNKSGIVAAQTISDMKAALKEAFSGDSAGTDIKLVPYYDDKMVYTVTDEATLAAQQQAEKNPIIFPVKLQVSEAERQRFLRSLGEFAGGNGADNDFSGLAEKSGSKS